MQVGFKILLLLKIIFIKKINIWFEYLQGSRPSSQSVSFKLPTGVGSQLGTLSRKISSIGRTASPQKPVETAGKETVNSESADPGIRSDLVSLAWQKS